MTDYFYYTTESFKIHILQDKLIAADFEGYRPAIYSLFSRSRTNKVLTC